MEANTFLREIYGIGKQMEEIRFYQNSLPFNNTEMLLLREVFMAKQAGRHVISSYLAKVLGVTRSAISQMVNKLESKNLVRRVADAKDRKIAYIELSEYAMETYEGLKARLNLFLKKVKERIGQEKIEQFFSSAHEFIDACGNVLEELAGKEGVPVKG